MALAPRAGAEDTEQFEPDRGAVERVTGKLAGTEAAFEVRYVAHITGQHVSSGMLRLELPVHGVVTGARARGRRLDMVPVKVAQAAIEALQRRKPGRRPRQAVAITEVQSGYAELEVATPPGTIAIDLAITAPTCFAHDVRYVAIPTSWKPALVGLRVVERKQLEHECPIDLRAPITIAWLALPSRELASRPSGLDRIGGVAGRLALGGKHVAKVELDLAARISDLPADLATVILVDASRSLSPAMRDSQRELVASYLRGAPRTLVQVIAYDRTARPLLPGWTLASQATGRIDRELRALAPRNGSNVDVAVRVAADWLGRVAGTRRLIVIGDDLLPPRIDEPAVAGLRTTLPPKTLVHVVRVNQSESPLDRTETATLGPLAVASRGIAVHGGGPKLDATMLVRPIAFERVVMKAPGWKTIDDSRLRRRCGGTVAEPDVLDEGASCTWYGEGTAISGPVVFEGMLWGERVVRVLRPDLGRSRAVARELDALDVALGTGEREHEHYNRMLAQATYAVGSAWSLYTEWGGDDGYDMTGGFGFGISGFGPSCCGDFVPPNLEPPRIRGSHEGVSTQLARAIARCKPDRPVRAHVGITLEEIVDVHVVTTADPLRTCVEDALWNTWLVAPDAGSHESIVVDG